MSRFEAGERILEIRDEIRELLQEAMDLVREKGTDLEREQARSYWYGRIMIDLGGDHGFLGSSMCSMEDTAEYLMEGEGSPDKDNEEEE